NLRPATFIELESLNDLARLACALERAPLPTFISKDDDSFRISTQLDFFVGSPVFYFAKVNETKQFLGYRTVSSGEEVTLVDVPLNPSMVYAPVIEVVKFPKVFEQGIAGKKARVPKFLSLQVKDLMGLVKVATYKIMFEEPPLPIFAFPSSSGKWTVGAFTRIEEFEEASIFFYYEQESRPEQNFVGYSTAKAQAFFTNRTDEHGNFFVKIIRLKHAHPLVDSD
ncbi:MAG TPA: hypothetical protein VED17_09345, partial [Nitrososphaerales archaeon]|nr:hypothetical protein [Nitrososphaerales archaeon]